MQTNNKPNKTEQPATKRGDHAKHYAVATVKVAFALAFLLAAGSLAGYFSLNAITKEILAGLNGILGIWILISNVR
jgi:hypothetical protein